MVPDDSDSPSLTPAKAYAISHEIDGLLNKALQEYDITQPQNYYGWQVLLRTVERSTSILKNCIVEPKEDPKYDPSIR